MRTLGILLGILLVLIMNKGFEELDEQQFEQSISQHHPKDGGNVCVHNPPRVEDVPCSIINPSSDSIVLYNEQGIRTTIPN